MLDAYLVLGSEQPSGPGPHRSRPDTDLGPHQAYAFQWWLTSLFGFVLSYRSASTTQTRREATSTVPKPKKVRIWDEEDG